jgi:hypothetical protein
MLSKKTWTTSRDWAFVNSGKKSFKGLSFPYENLLYLLRDHTRLFAAQPLALPPCTCLLDAVGHGMSQLILF